MAYVGTALTLVTASVEGTFNVFAYVTADTIATVTTRYYFSDGINHGTHNTIVTGNNVSAMPAGYGIICASGQGNNVTNNTGAANCAP